MMTTAQTRPARTRRERERRERDLRRIIILILQLGVDAFTIFKH